MIYLVRRLVHFAQRALKRLNQYKLKAVSLLEAAFGMVIVGLFLAGMWKTFILINNRLNEARIHTYLDQISRAAANYAYREGCLPPPEGVEPPQYGAPESWLTTTKLRGKIPWKELGLPCKPVVNGKEFTWVVSLTAIRRPDWKHLQADRDLHLLPTFWTNKHWATFARPRWCGIYGGFWWPNMDMDVPNQEIHSYLGKEHCQYTIQTVTRDRDNQFKPTESSYKFAYLTPRPPQSAQLSSAVFLDILQVYELEMEVGLNSVRQIADHSDQYSPLASYVGYVITSDASTLVRSARLAKLERLVWIDEPVLAIAYDAEKSPIPGNQLAVELTPHTLVWTRFCLLALAQYFDTTFYTHPGYCWRNLDPEKEKQLKKATVSESAATPAKYQLHDTPFCIYGDNKGSRTALERAHLTVMRSNENLYNGPAALELSLRHAAGIAALRNRGAIIACNAPNKHKSYTYDHDFLFSAYLLEWLRAILCLDGLQPLRTDIHGAIKQVETADQIEQDLILWQTAAAEIRKILADVKKKLDEEEAKAKLDQEQSSVNSTPA